MYVITNHNEQNFVILGPIEWKPKFISDVLTDEFDEVVTVTREDENKVPYEVYPGVMIRKCISIHEELDEDIERHEGPFWEYDVQDKDYQAIARWVKTDKNLELAKFEVKQEVSRLRWEKENSGIEFDGVFVSTARGERDTYTQKYSFMNDDVVTNWKFPSGWKELTKSDLAAILVAISDHVQTQFDWEHDLVEQIEAATTLQDLKLIKEQLE